MFKLLLPILLAVAVFSSAGAEVQRGVPEDNLALPSSGKSARQPSSASAQQPSSNSISDEEESKDSDATTTAPAAAQKDAAAAAPADVTRASTSSSSASSTAPPPPAAARSALLLSTVVKSVPGIQHHILPAQTIPLPITIETRAGLRTVIAPETITIHEPTIAKVGEVVQRIPTAVSHHSQTIVHQHARVVTPIVAPAVRTTTSQVLRAYHTPLIYAPHTVRVVGN